MGGQAAAGGPDFAAGIERSAVADGATVAGRVGDEPVLLSCFGGDYFAVGGACTHYGAALADGLIADGTARCPLHHACFDLKTGAVHIPGPDNKGRKDREKIDGGAANILDIELDATRTLKSLTVRSVANEVVIGLMAVSLER